VDVSATPTPLAGESGGEGEQIVGDGGEIHITADNVTNSGTLKADATEGNGGAIKLESTDTTLVTGNATISATSTPSPLAGEGRGEGGTVHILGDKVGLLDMTSVDVSGALG